MNRASSGSKPASRAIRNRIVLVMTVILMLSTIVAGYCLYLVMQSTAQQDASAAQSHVVITTAGKITGLVKTLHQLEDQFLSSQDIESMAQFNTLLAQLSAQGRALESAAGSVNDAKTAQVAASLLQTIQEYEASLKERAQAWEAKGLDNAAGLQAKLHGKSEEITSITPVSQPKKMADVLGEVNRAEVEYLAAGNQETLTELEIASNTLQEIIKRSSVSEPEKGLLQKGIKNYIGALNRYQAVSLATDDPVLQTAFAAEQEKLKKDMRSTAQQLEAVISNLQVSPLEAKITLIRQYEKEYLQKPSDQNVTLLNQAISDASQEVQLSSLPVEQKEALLQALTGYRDVFNQLADLDSIILETVSQSAHYLAQLDSQVKELPLQPPPAPNIVDQLKAFITRPDVLPAAAAVVGLLLFGIIAAGGLARSVSALPVRQSDPAPNIPAEQEPKLSVPDEAEHAGAQELPPGFADILANLDRTVRKLIDLSDTLPGVVTKMTEQNLAVQEFLQAQAQSDTSGVPHASVDPEKTGRLSDISRTADEITEEMDMLALNAAIKAERAGVHGREFTLVADELEKLAKRSAATTRDLTEILGTISDGQDEILPSADKDGENMQDIAEVNAANTKALDALAVETNIIIDQAREIQQSVAELGGIPDQSKLQDEPPEEEESWDDINIDLHDDTAEEPEDASFNDANEDAEKS